MGWAISLSLEWPGPWLRHAAGSITHGMFDAMNPQQEIAVKPSLRLTERELQSILAHWDLPEGNARVVTNS